MAVSCTVNVATRFLDVTSPQIQAVVVHALSHLRKKEGSVTVHCIGEKRIQTLNREHRGIDRPTDVLSFPLQSDVSFGGESDIGDIFLAPTYIRRQARRFGVSPREETVRMTIHGVLHLLGYDHEAESEAKKMFSLQERLLREALLKVF